MVNKCVQEAMHRMYPDNNEKTNLAGAEALWSRLVGYNAKHKVGTRSWGS